MFKREPLHDEPLSDQLRELRQRGDGFRLPANYLDELRDRIPDAEQPAAAPRIRPLYRRKTWLAIAASVALLLTLGWAWLYRPVPAPSIATTEWAATELDALSEEDILAYVEDNIGEFELTLLYETQDEATTDEVEDLSETLSDEDLDALYYEWIEDE